MTNLARRNDSRRALGSRSLPRQTRSGPTAKARQHHQIAAASRGTRERIAQEPSPLLAAIVTIFERRETSCLRSLELVHELNRVEDAPWAPATGRLSAQGLAASLAQYDISSRLLRFGTKRYRGYERIQFDKVLERESPELAVDLERSNEQRRRDAHACRDRAGLLDRLRRRVRVLASVIAN